MPVEVDPKFGSVTLNVEFDCLLADRCSNGPQSWDGALEWTGADPFSHSAVGKINHTWNAANNADKLDLSTKITAYSPVANASATRWQADGAQIRCDKISSDTPGCTFYKYIPTWVMNFIKTPCGRRTRVADPVQAAHPPRQQGSQQATVLSSCRGQERAQP